ncbi:MAG: lamin tail domain-containing protein [Flavobacteriia bacterium]|nr:lamin tail domain-containing protein [Flavobacteriia bacterium]
MKTKLTTLMLLLTFITVAQFKPIDQNKPLDIKREKIQEWFNNSTFVVEVDTVSVKQIFKNTGINEIGLEKGEIYLEIIYKVKNKLKGNVPKSELKIYLYRGRFQYINDSKYNVSASDHFESLPFKGILFLSNKEGDIKNFDETNYKRIGVISYHLYNSEAVNNYLIEEFNIKFKETREEKKNESLQKDFPKKKKEPIEKINKLNSVKERDTLGFHNRYQKRLDKYNLRESQIKKLVEQNNISTITRGVDCEDIFISEYVEGTNHNNAIELFNPTENAIDLADYVIKVFYNGTNSPIDVPLTGTLPSKETFVVAHPNANSSILEKSDLTHQNMNYNGDDAVSLYKNSSQTHLDIIGEIGVNPGNGGWDVPQNGSTKDRTLIRKQPVGKGQPDWVQAKLEWKILPINYINNLKMHHGKCRSSVDVNFEIANVSETNDGTNNFLEFDIMVSSNTNDSYLQSAQFSIQYDATTFGTYMVQNGLVNLTNGLNFASATYDDVNNLLIDKTSNTLGIGFDINYALGSFQRTLITSSPQQLLHIKLQFSTCNLNPNISFTDQNFNSNFNLFTLTSDAFWTDNSNYNNSNYLGSITDPLCKPIITESTPTVYPGAYFPGNPTNLALMTIKGRNFGATRGTSNVYFKNGNNSTLFPEALLDEYDFSCTECIWSDTEIRLQLPSIINGFINTERVLPTSGDFYIKLNDDNTQQSNLKQVNCPYAIHNQVVVDDINSTFEKTRIHLLNQNNIGGYTIHIDNSISQHSNPAVRQVVLQAIEDWKFLGVNVTVLEDVNNYSGDDQDGINVLYFKSILGLDVVGETSFPEVTCTENATTTDIPHMREFDVAFLSSANWQFNTSGDLQNGKFDFYEVVLHELGHAFGFGHTRTTDLMFPTASEGFVSSTSRKKIGQYNIEGIENILNRSSSIVYSTICSLSPMIILALCPTNSITETSSYKFNIYPIPSKEEITIDLGNDVVESIVELTDMNGKIIFSSTIKNKINHISLNYFNSGVYFINISNSNHSETRKLIKY